MLRLAACLEEHYPHSMANAVVEEAKRRGLAYEEYHSQVQYVVAHGISSRVEGKKVLIASAHFVFEDEGCRIPTGEQAKFDALSDAYSHLYLCIDGTLAAVLCIHDPLRREARDAIRALHSYGFSNVVMMTGDNRRTAEAVAAEVGVDAVYAEVLPEDKAAFIRSKKAKGHTVLMVGDGVNDFPCPVGSGRRHCHFHRRCHRPRDCRHHGCLKRSFCAGDTAQTQRSTDAAHPRQLALYCGL